MSETMKTERVLNRPSAGRHYLLAGVLLGAAYLCHILICCESSLVQLPYVFDRSDMQANLLWAQSIREQGWVNPHPYHPYVAWQQRFGKPDEWARWWGGEAIFQQSPLYVYLLVGMQLFSKNLIYVHLLQGVLAVGLCAALGVLAFRISNDKRAGWITFVLASCYAPFFAYSFVLLRDILGWFLTAVLVLVLVEIDVQAENRPRLRWLSAVAGMLMGVGYLARESFLLLIPVVLLLLAFRYFRQKEFTSPLLLGCALGIALFPLILRNHLAGAPLLSSSNRFAEAFICGNSAHSKPNLFVIPPETGDILNASGGKQLAVMTETIKTHPTIWGWVWLQFEKVLSLFDPYEPCDNLSIYFVENISPFVKWGLRHWMLIIPGIGGLVLGICRRDKRHLWLWALFPVLLASVVLSIPLSRYRQILALFWIPWAGVFLVWLWQQWNENRRTAILAGTGVLAGWVLCLGPCAQIPRFSYERPQEYLMSVWIYQKQGQFERAKEMERLVQQKFPLLSATIQARTAEPPKE